MQNGSFDMSALVARLESMSDPNYRDFNLSLVPGIEAASLGIRIPALRSLGRELLMGDWRAFLEASRDHPLFEVRMLHAIVLRRPPRSASYSPSCAIARPPTRSSASASAW